MAILYIFSLHIGIENEKKLYNAYHFKISCSFNI